MPVAFYDTPDIQAALGRYDFGPVFLAVREAARLSQHQLAELTGLAQSTVSKIESGARGARDIEHVVRIANTLRIPAHLLGFGADPGSLKDGAGEVSWMQRRDFLTVALGITMGSAEIARLSEILPTPADPSRRRRIGVADAQAIEHMTEQLRSTIYETGGGLMHLTALSYLHAVQDCDDAECTDQVRQRVDLATADLAWIAGWAAWDAEQHDQAKELWGVALTRARRAEAHPRSTDLMIGVLLDSAYQALAAAQRSVNAKDRQRQAVAASRLVDLGSHVAATNQHAASASAQADLHASRAWCYGLLGESGKCQDSLSQEAAAFATIEPNTVPPWARHVTEAEIASHGAHAFALLARTQPSAAPRAIEHLDAVVNSDDLTYRRTRAFHLPDLSANYLRVGEIETGIRVGQEALSAVDELSSRHARARLQIVADAAKPFIETSEELAALCAKVDAAVHEWM
ncbi:helix-turn-helix domain-containing protein [Saccharopolyspora sp. K220]|uniref:helix-turn-helix domain-containing protein n=1 Tax=Saccharopolyspora soli TaxID=2926618 RepID=UPI001F56C147|nr:helix-turn-helix transcriptional regulator [Saccharopolyspora soli]MCI2422897.1 helix-turn-helix domain-containing protein [Saccharopolyspora soli]